jgi:alkylation response protein AidB-like acyl-CoA dehydrogenase
MQFQFADVHTEIEAARMLTYNAARLKEEGKPFTEMAAMAKLFSSQVAQNASGSAIEWCGGVGFTRETGIEKYWRDSKIVSSSFAFLAHFPVYRSTNKQ